SRRRHTRWPRDWSSDVCSSDLRTSCLGVDQWVLDPPCFHCCPLLLIFKRVPLSHLSPSSYNLRKIKDLRAISCSSILPNFMCSRSEERRVGKECIFWRLSDIV